MGRARRDAERRARAAARLGAAIHSVRAVDPESARAVAAWANERGLPLHAHVSEQQAENDDVPRRVREHPAGVLDEAGALVGALHRRPRHPPDRRRRRALGRAGATCCLCPTTERDLADGIAEARRLRDAGAASPLGSDSHAVIDLFEEARAVELDERLATYERGRHRAADLLRAATADGHASIGWPEAGRIEEEPSPIWSPSALTRCGSPALRPTRPRVGRVRGHGGRRARGDRRRPPHRQRRAHAEIDVAAELAAAIERVYA